METTNFGNLEKSYRGYTIGFLDKICNSHTIKCEKTIMPLWKILFYGFINGHCGLTTDNDGNLIFGVGQYTGKLLLDGTMDKYIITFENGTTKTITIGVDGVVFRYNKLGFSRLPMVNRYAEQLADVDLSQMLLIKYSRLIPIPQVSDDLEEKSLKSVLTKLFSGDFHIFKRNRQLMENEQFFTGASSELKTLDLTNPQASEYMQHLSRYHDELIIRCCLENGIMVTARDKGAQLNDEELTAFESYCAIGGYSLNVQLQEMCESVKTVLNIEITAEPNSFITTETENYREIDEKGDNENVDNKNIDNEN